MWRALISSSREGRDREVAGVGKKLEVDGAGRKLERVEGHLTCMPYPHPPILTPSLTRILPKRQVNAAEQSLPSGIKASSAITYSRSTSSCGPREDSAVRPPLLPAL